MIMRINIDWKEIISFTYHFTTINNVTTNNQFCLKGIWRWRKFDNILTMTQIIISINITIFYFHNYQRHVHHITTNNSSINVFLIFFICSIIKIHYNPVIVTTKNLRVFATIYYTISRLVNGLFDILILRNI